MKPETEKRIRDCFAINIGRWLSVSELAHRANTHYYAIVQYVAANRKTIRVVHGGRFFLYSLRNQKLG